MSISTSLMVASSGQQPVVGKMPGAVPKVADGASSAVPMPKPAADVRAARLDKPDAEQVLQSLNDINKAMADFSISVQFQIDPDYKELIVRVVDQDTGKLIRQIPTEEVVKISKAMDNLKGLLFAQSA